ncbi:MAG: TRAP transporter small permease [Desulfitobacteriaceae bacterium]
MRDLVRVFSWVSEFIQKVFIILTGIILIVMVGLTGLAVFYRYILHSSLAWSEEMDSYLFVWLTCLGAAVGYKFRAHPQVVVIVDRLPKLLKRITTAAADLVVLILGVLLALYGGKMIALMGTETASTVPMSMIYPYLAIPVGGIGLCFHAINHILMGIYPSDHHDEEAGTWQHSA